MLSKQILAAGVGIAGLFILAAVISQPIERWPAVERPDGTVEAVSRQVEKEKEKPFNFRAYLSNYVPTGDYLEYSQKGVCETNLAERLMTMDWRCSK
jgi:hypothetical protein